MTENHRAEGRLESVRLRRMMGTGVIADSFGDSRYVYSVFNGMRMPISWKVDGRPRKYEEVCSMSRRHPGLDVRSSTHSLGDLKWKAWGVTAEPEVKTKLIESQWWCKPYLKGCGV
jgi:protein phosphatase PTC6